MTIKGHHIGIVAIAVIAIVFFAVPIGGMTLFTRVKAAV